VNKAALVEVQPQEQKKFEKAKALRPSGQQIALVALPHTWALLTRGRLIGLKPTEATSCDNSHGEPGGARRLQRREDELEDEWPSNSSGGAAREGQKIPISSGLGGWWSRGGSNP
jgi:hypothetical protein